MGDGSRAGKKISLPPGLAAFLLRAGLPHSDFYDMIDKKAARWGFHRLFERPAAWG
jgi:hypothetical protein